MRFNSASTHSTPIATAQKPNRNTPMNTLINKSKVKRYILEFAEANRAHKFSRVSQETIDRVEAAARSACKAIVTQAPSKGKTL
jgi:hypothetical protein